MRTVSARQRIREAREVGAVSGRRTGKDALSQNLAAAVTRSEDPTAEEFQHMRAEIARRRESYPLVDYFCIHPSDWAATRLSLNDRLHFRANADRTAFWRELAGILGRRVRARLAEGRVEIVYRFPDNIEREVSNLQSTSKAILDGVVDAGIYPGDHDAIMMGPDNLRDPVNGPHRVTVLLYGRRAARS
ncbi:RusA-like resolvase [Arthrobacter phage Bumble]|uniref:RusA-like resolvase n=1 Tax=Arthrobacter phage Bumble TaxID=2743904 RepID=A0A7G3V9S4_9CAUD|nr:RusA-like resolvase [Arthrobacter phage Bumble]